MARVGGINIPDNKHIDVSLSLVFLVWPKYSSKNMQQVKD